MKQSTWSAIFFSLAVSACSELPQQVKPPRVMTAAIRGGSASAVVRGEYVVQFRESAPNARGLMRGLLNASGGSLKSEHLALAGAFVAKLPAAAAEAIARNPHVRSVEPNVTISTMSVQNGAPSWGLRRIDQRSRPIDNAFKYPADGNGVHIYILDTGTDPQHEEFGTRMTGGVSTVGDNIGLLDGCLHGTAVASVAGGMTHGPAKQARLYAVKVMDRYCIGDVSSYLYGLEWIRDHHVAPAVVNVSVAFDVIVSAVDSAVQSLIATTGISVVVAAGNNAMQSCNGSPARVPGAITVGATDSTDTRAAFSAIGTCVDLYAPGVDILMAGYDYDNFPSDHNDWAMGSGTSFAAPFVSGVVAAYLQRNPSATPATVHAQIVNTATAGAVQFPGIDTPNRLLYQAPASILVAGLTGPTSVRPNATCGWEAEPSGGVGPYFYDWYKNGSIQQSSTDPLFLTSLSTGGTISVNIFDAYGSTVSASRIVSTSSTANRCRY